MRAYIKTLAEMIDTPPSDRFMTPVNGRTPHARVQALHKQAVKRIRDKQVSRYSGVQSRADRVIADDLEAINEVLKATAQMRRDLKRGLIEPAEVMDRVAASIRGTQEVIADVEQVERDEEAATAMVDMAPDEYEQILLERFPSMAEQATPFLTEEFLRGEQESPFLDGGAE